MRYEIQPSHLVLADEVRNSQMIPQTTLNLKRYLILILADDVQTSQIIPQKTLNPKPLSTEALMIPSSSKSSQTLSQPVSWQGKYHLVVFAAMAGLALFSDDREI